MLYCGLDSSGLEHNLLGGSCEQGNEPSGSMNCLETLDKLSN
jgi:hypothetical protein